MIQSESIGDRHCRSIGDACIGTLFVDLSYERNAPMGIDDAKRIFASFGIEHGESDAERLATLLNPAAFAPAGTPSYCYLIASLDDQGDVNWGKFSTRDDFERAWAECEEYVRLYECEE
jgi:hypothetical protein